MLLRFASIYLPRYAVGLEDTTTTLHCYSVRFVLHLIAPQPPPAGPEQRGDSCRLLLIPILSCASVGACAFCPRLSLRPPLRLFP